jgi:hypothetical protein
LLLIVYKNITKNNNLLSLAIQNKNIKTNISHPPQRKKKTLKEKIYMTKYGGCRDRVEVGFITTYAISAHHH